MQEQERPPEPIVDPRERGGWFLPEGLDELIASIQEIVDGKRKLRITIEVIEP